MKNHLGLIFAIFFFLFAALQYNDPDPWTWIIIYGVAALAALFHWMDKVSDVALLVLGVGFLVYSFSYTAELIDWAKNGFADIAGEMKAENPHIELVRESLGLVIVGVSLFYLSRIKKT